MEHRSVSLKVAGQHLKLKTDQPDEVLRSVVAMIEERVAMLKGKSIGPPSMKIMVMVSMMLATELQEVQVRLNNSLSDIEGRADAALALLEGYAQE